MAAGRSVRALHTVLLFSQLLLGLKCSSAFNLKVSSLSLFGSSLRPDYPTNVHQNDGGKFELYEARGNGLAFMKISLWGNSIMQPAHFDTDILAHVIEGCAKWGMVYGSGDWVDAVSTLKAGDAFVIPKEAVVWFYNEDESNTFSFIGVGETSCGLKPGRITALPVVGSASMYQGFDDKSVADAWAVEKVTARKVMHNQGSSLFVKLSVKINLSRPEAKAAFNCEYVFPTWTVDPDLYMPGGGKQWTVLASKSVRHSILRKINLAGELIEQYSRSMYGPMFSTNVNQLLYVIKGRGHLVMVEPFKNDQILDTRICEGQVISIPKGYGYLITGDYDEEITHFTVADNSGPAKTFFAGKQSMYLGIPWEILRASFAVGDSIVDKVLHSRTWEYTILPPYGSADSIDQGSAEPEQPTEKEITSEIKGE
ncbi:protein MpCupin3 [Marchantia polymorpha subsp. ruderalis]|uniref:Cupin type-1 domain-containing protein n=2 Tax=Marchantia polymorpha TaxID=3197 RepID=A0AAF6ARJ9_MARPO|nr:hypothetical protein MARPO_0001s0185 [Marchantia polymorpha]BBM99069.1 hypothetical protein Mp_1g18470 [Marchantia polymorpha subsp. ruderalis]|eukprot:PTQ50146.1 hypothetical protein MARPO_0001s0185 [Marchantia polymorpha]